MGIAYRSYVGIIFPYSLLSTSKLGGLEDQGAMLPMTFQQRG